MQIPLCVFITVFTGTCLLGYYFANKNRRIERYYSIKNKKLYLLLQFANFVLMISFAFNSRFVASHLFKMFTKYIKAKLA